MLVYCFFKCATLVQPRVQPSCNPNCAFSQALASRAWQSDLQGIPYINRLLLLHFDLDMLSLHVVLFAGKQRAQYQVSKLDSSDTIQEQWQGVVRIVQDSSSAFMYHLENHYCLVFAARSWRMDAGTFVSCE
jgi:hypothetical protein